jgi:hypothetical protein
LYHAAALAARSPVYIGKLAQRQVVAVSAGLSDKLPQSW